MTSTKPYLLRAIHEWILDNQMTPHLVIDSTYPGVRAPLEYADEDGRLVLNISLDATRHLLISNDWIEFNARFGGVARDVLIPTEAALGIFTRENGQGMVFPDPEIPEDTAAPDTEQVPAGGAALRSVETLADTAPDQAETDAGRKDRPRTGPSLKVVK